MLDLENNGQVMACVVKMPMTLMEKLSWLMKMTCLLQRFEVSICGEVVQCLYESSNNEWIGWIYSSFYGWPLNNANK